MRKMILTGALVLFGEGTTTQVVAALAVCIVWLTLIANLKPFGDDADDRLAQVEALQVLLTLLMGLVLQLQAATADGAQADDEALGAVLIALNCIVVALALVQQPIVRTLADRVCVRPYRRCKTREVADAGRVETGGHAAPTTKGMPPQHSNPMRRAELAMAAAAPRTSGGATAIEMTRMPMYANPLHRDAVSAGGLKGVPPSAGGDDVLLAGGEQRQDEGRAFSESAKKKKKKKKKKKNPPSIGSAAPPEDDVLPAGWERRQNEGKVFFKNVMTIVMQWDHP
jgi:hypothetical protein